MAKPIINVADAETHTANNGEYFGYSMTELAGALGAMAIGANLTRVPPGTGPVSAWPGGSDSQPRRTLSAKAIMNEQIR